MQRWKSIIYNISFALNCLLVFLLVFEPKLLVPSWLQVAGRMHPLILHFPIVLMILAIVWELFMRPVHVEEKTERNIGDLLLLAASFTAVFTSLMGLFLSKEGGYSEDTLVVHKWGGVIVSLLTLAWYSLRERNIIDNRLPALHSLVNFYFINKYPTLHSTTGMCSRHRFQN